AALEGVDRRLLPERAAELADRAGAVPEVGAGAEGTAGPGDDGDPRLVLVPESGEGGVQVAPQLAVDGVQGVGPVVRDRGDVVVEVVEHGVSHGASLYGAP